MNHIYSCSVATMLRRAYFDDILTSRFTPRPFERHFALARGGVPGAPNSAAPPGPKSATVGPSVSIALLIGSESMLGSVLRRRHKNGHDHRRFDELRLV